MTVRIVKHSFEIIYLLSGENPLQVKDRIYSIMKKKKKSVMWICISYDADHGSSSASMLIRIGIQMRIRILIQIRIQGVLIGLKEVYMENTRFCLF